MVDMITRYEPALSLWKATNKEQRGFLATSNAPEMSLLVGVHNWTIYNDSKLCSLDSSYTTVLKIIGCSQKEFTCNALWVKANGKRAIGISELCLSFYSHPNISDGNFILIPHFNRTQIFQIDLSRLK